MSINTLNTLSQFAQVTGAPPSGASRSSDFQPPTRNPQQAPGSLQQGGQLNGTSGSQDILTDNPNARIIVPVNPADPQPQTLANTTDGGWGLWWIVLGGLIVAAVLYAWRQSYKNKKDFGMKVAKVAKTDVAKDLGKEKPAPKKQPAKPKKPKTPAKPKKKPAAKKKSRRQRRKS